MASNISFCGLCDQQHIATPSTDWCPECEEALCTSCKKHHSLSKASRNHKTIPIENYQKLPSFISDIKQYCEEHQDKYHMLCQKHDRPLCHTCVKDHTACIDIVPLEDVIKGMKTEDMVRSTKQSLSDLLENLATMKKDREANITSIDAQKQKFLMEVQGVRRKINEHLDILEAKMIMQLDSVGDQATKSIKDTSDVIIEKETQIVQLMRMVENVKTYASDLQVYFGIRQMDSIIRENEEFLQSLLDKKKLEKVEVNCTVDSKLKEILSIVQTLGTVEVKTSQSTIKIKRSKDKQAQQLVTTPSRTFSDIKVTLKQKIITDGEAVRGCCVRDDGDLLFADHNFSKKLIVFNSEGKFKKNFTIENSSVFDVVYIGNQTVAVTSGNSPKNCIDIIDLNTTKILKTISLPDRVCGVSHNNKSLFCCVPNRNIHVISLTDNTVTTIDNTVLPWCSYVAAYGDKVLYSNPSEHAVSCCQLNGKLVWKFKDKDILQRPRGITVDGTGNVYVVGEDTSNVLVISPDGKNHREILSKIDELDAPTAVYVNKSDNTLLVANDEKNAFLFNISFL